MKWLLCSILLLGVSSTVKAEEEWTWPVSGKISDYFGTRAGKHYGIDIAASSGTPVLAATDGQVSKSYYSESYGNVIFIRHADYETVYAHLSQRTVKEGDRIKGGQVIGLVGNTGHSFGAHLHFEVHKKEWSFAKNNAVNPLLVLGDVPSEMTSSYSYVVQKGDTLSKIARKFGTTVEQLKGQNGLRSDRIYLEQKLVIN
jgi:murein DD-endopeptidase MepM/ murein hydrolase activator NlpD